MYYFMCVMLTSDVNCLFTPRSEENNGKKTEIIDQPRFHADTHSTSQKCPLISSLTPLFDSTNYLALFRSYQRAIIHCQTFSVARGERNAHFSVLAPRLLLVSVSCVVTQGSLALRDDTGNGCERQRSHLECTNMFGG